MDDAYILSGAEARSLYRECLRELRGVEADVVVSVRAAAREKLRESSGEASAEHIRALLIDGHHLLDTLRSSLGTAVLKPDWALRPGVHATRDQLEHAHRSSPLQSPPGLTVAQGCSLEHKKEMERSWAVFVETKLRPTFAALEGMRQARVAMAGAAMSPQRVRAAIGTMPRRPSRGAAVLLGGQLRSCRGLSSAAAPETPEAAIRRLHAVMVEAAEHTHETFVPTVGDDGMLVIDLGGKGQYSMQPHNGQLILFSPVSGPCYYAFDGGNCWWIDPNDGHLLDEKLVREMMHITAVYLNL